MILQGTPARDEAPGFRNTGKIRTMWNEFDSENESAIGLWLDPVVAIELDDEALSDDEPLDLPEAHPEWAFGGAMPIMADRGARAEPGKDRIDLDDLLDAIFDSPI